LVITDIKESHCYCGQDLVTGIIRGTENQDSHLHLSYTKKSCDGFLVLEIATAEVELATIGMGIGEQFARILAPSGYGLKVGEEICFEDGR
jgi:hypothetical protein